MRIARHVTALLLLAPIPMSRIGVAPPSAADDPPGRVGRVSYLSGAVSFRPGSADAWTTAQINYPLTGGDHLWTDADARAEVTLGSTALRLAPYTGFGFLALDDHTTQIRLTEGSLQVRIRRLDDETFEIDTPNGAVSLLRTGTYRVDVDSGGDTTTVTVRRGSAEVTAAGSAFSVEAEQAASVVGGDSPTYDVHAALGTDDFEAWAELRDRRPDEAVSAHYVSREMSGYEDLDDNGAWRVADTYGPVWVPRAVAVGWAPYRFGHWAWVEPWGWTWIDDAPWGFAPFHYGRWVYWDGGWAWVPGRLVARPVYAPALVAFVGGSNWSISLFAGGGGGVAWFPLGPNEVYVPAYHVTRTYVRNVNVTNVNVTNINVTNVNVTNVRYVNRDVPGGVTAVSRETFVGSRAVGQGAVIVPRERLRETSVTTTATVAPRRESLLQSGASPATVPQPPAGLATRRVVTRTAPPPPPVPFTARQHALEANPGRPLDDRAVAAHRARAPAAQPNPIAVPATRPAAAPAGPPGGPAVAPTLRPARADLPPPRPVVAAPVTPRASDRPPPPTVQNPVRDQLDARHAAEHNQLEQHHQAELQQQAPRAPDPAVMKRLAEEDRALAEKQQRERDAVRRESSARPNDQPKPKEPPKDQRPKPRDKPRGDERRSP